MKTLFIVHVEEMFRDYFPADLLTQIAFNIASNDYSKIVFLHSYINDDSPCADLISLLDNNRISYEVWDFAWGYEPIEDHCTCDYETIDYEHKRDCHDESCFLHWIIPSKGHDWTWIPEELRQEDFNGDTVHVSGGCQDECLADFESVLDSLNINNVQLTNCTY